MLHAALKCLLGATSLKLRRALVGRADSRITFDLPGRGHVDCAQSKRGRCYTIRTCQRLVPFSVAVPPFLAQLIWPPTVTEYIRSLSLIVFRSSAALRLWAIPHGQVRSRISIPRRKPHPPHPSLDGDDGDRPARSIMAER